MAHLYKVHISTYKLSKNDRVRYEYSIHDEAGKVIHQEAEFICREDAEEDAADHITLLHGYDLLPDTKGG